MRRKEAPPRVNPAVPEACAAAVRLACCVCAAAWACSATLAAGCWQPSASNLGNPGQRTHACMLAASRGSVKKHVKEVVRETHTRQASGLHRRHACTAGRMRAQHHHHHHARHHQQQVTVMRTKKSTQQSVRVSHLVVPPGNSLPGCRRVRHRQPQRQVQRRSFRSDSSRRSSKTAAAACMPHSRPRPTLEGNQVCCMAADGHIMQQSDAANVLECSTATGKRSPRAGGKHRRARHTSSSSRCSSRFGQQHRMQQPASHDVRRCHCSAMHWRQPSLRTQPKSTAPSPAAAARESINDGHTTACTAAPGKQHAKRARACNVCGEGGWQAAAWQRCAHAGCSRAGLECVRTAS